FFMRCSDNHEADKATLPHEDVDADQKVSQVLGIINNQKSVVGDTLILSFKSPERTTISSVEVILNGKTMKSSGDDLVIYTSGSPTGHQNIVVSINVDDKIEKHILSIEFLSDIIPVAYTYRRIAWFTHDPDAFTQGLFFHNGFLYESTGRRGQSTLRKVELSSGKVLKKTYMADNIFAEGATLWEDQIIQITYTSQKGFVYDIDGFEQLKTFNYSTETREGWGITTIDSLLVMSDGSETLYFLDPESLMEVNRIKVYDNEGPVKNVNELEFIEGVIYANVWQTDDIITIDIVTGKVLARIDLTDLMNANWSRTIDFLNGIAYDPDSKRLFVTGKLWPRLYEIKLLEKKPS
ncbi:MAG: glutaminyl-peptide cyclotransferase, partial [Bacteroidetes bacterium]|nr:glutaminyl-peptide cyclotransferase [Bacteroidota bacterium]